MQQAQEVLDRYEPVIQKMARFIRPFPSVLDHRAQDRSDYVSLFRTTALRTHQDSRRRNENSGFVWTSIRNLAVSSRRRPKSCTFVPLDHAPEQLDEHCLASQVEAREIVAKLRDTLCPQDMELLEAWTASDTYSDAWKLTGRSHTGGAGARRIRAIIQRARAILEELSVLGPDVGAHASIPSERSAMREQLQKTAERLGVPFTNETTDAELQSMIAARTSVVEPPKKDAEAPPDCFGLMWGADVDPKCQGCDYRESCRTKMANSTIPELLVTSPGLSPDQLANELGIDTSSVVVLLGSRSVQKTVSQPPAPPTVAPAKEDSVKAAPNKAKTKAKVAPKATLKAKAPPKNGKLPHGEAAAAMEAAPVDPRSTGSVLPVTDPVVVPGEGSAAPAAVQAPVRRSKRRVISMSGKATPVALKSKTKIAKATSSRLSSGPKAKSSLKAKTKTKAAPKVKARAQRPEGSEPWGLHTFRSRWERERLRSPAIAAVKPGQKLTRGYKDAQYEVQCRDGYWMTPDGKRHATLYSVTLEATGGLKYPVNSLDGKRVKGKTRVMSNYSAARFWRLAPG